MRGPGQQERAELAVGRPVARIRLDSGFQDNASPDAAVPKLTHQPRLMDDRVLWTSRVGRHGEFPIDRRREQFVKGSIVSELPDLGRDLRV